MRRRRFGTALLLSLVLHLALLGLMLWRASGPNPLTEWPQQKPVEIDVVHLPPREAAKPTPPVRAPTPPPPRVLTKKDLPRQQPPPKEARPPVDSGSSNTASAAPPPSGSNAAEAPPRVAAEDAPRKLNLEPQLPFAPQGPGVAAGSEHGHTYHPGDPEFSPEVQKQEEEHRVAGRVKDWANDGLAEARAGASAGGGHPYYSEVGGAMRGGLSHAKGGSLAELGAPSMPEHMFNRWKQGMSDYARTGNPNIGTPGEAPTQDEKQKELLGPEGQWVQGLTQGARTMQDLQQGRPLLALTFELLQGRDGHYKDGKILKGSGSAKFDAFVLRVVPSALEKLGPPPDIVLHGREELRSIWSIEGWPAYTQLETQLPSVGIQAVPFDPIRKAIKGDGEFDFRARLLRAY